MAISPPSDILLDVASAANPAKVQAATERLAKLAADSGATNVGFGEALAQAKAGNGGIVGNPTSGFPLSGAAGAGGTTAPSAGPGAFAHRPSAHVKPSVYTKFEAVLLQSFVEAMLPKDAELFGDKISAGAYRSMMAEQFATEIAKGGGIGLAKAIESAHPALQRVASTTTPQR